MKATEEMVSAPSPGGVWGPRPPSIFKYRQFFKKMEIFKLVPPPPKKKPSSHVT